MIDELRKDLQKVADPAKAEFVSRYFKTGKGEYGEGDVFVGITVPNLRTISKKYFKQANLADIEKLLHSAVHEERMVALQMLRLQFQKGDAQFQKTAYDFYLSNIKFINNWDLIDGTADAIVGEYLLTRHSGKRSASRIGVDSGQARVTDIFILEELARSPIWWERRIAIMATYQFIKNGYYQPTFKLAEMLLSDKHDLIHKAVGWMLREVGNRVSQEKEEEFLKKYYKKMPRTMLRYAIEKFEEKKRLQYLKGEI